MIELRNIHKSYSNAKVVALKDVSLSVERGKICGIIGKSGAGKSTLIRCVNFIERPDTGNVIVGGVDLSTLNPTELRNERRKIGMIFQHFNLLSSRTVFDNIAFPLELCGVDRTEIKRKVSNLMLLTGLDAKEDAYPAQLSGGQKQRVAIARALATDPDILLCDEATSALDPETTQSILQLLKKLNKELGLTILLITHEIEVIKTICDDVVVLDDAAVVEHCSTLELFTSPKTEVTKSLIRSALKFDLPKHVQSALHIEKTDHGQTPVVRIEFIGDRTAEPLLSNLSLRHGLEFNILQANIELVQEQTIGVMIVEVYGDESTVNKGINYLNEQGLITEVIGYAGNK